MIKDLLDRLKGDDPRSALLDLKTELKRSDKEGTLSDTLLIDVKEDLSLLRELLGSEDPKIRQNSAVCLGMLDRQSAPELIAAYKADETLYNKAAYLKALAYTDYSAYLNDLKDRLAYIMSADITPDALKHYSEEVRELNSLIRSQSAAGRSALHNFTGYELVNECVLLTNRNFKNITAAGLEGIPHKEFTAGLMVKTKHINKVLEIRTFDEILFIPEGIRVCSNDPAKAALELCSAGADRYIRARLSDPDIPITFRADLRTADSKYKTSFEKQFAMNFEAASGWHFINSVSDYEIEIRFIEGAKDKLNLLIKFCTLRDKRFAYRKASLSVGMKPVAAALCISLAAPYLKANAAVLDPFCGVGTMLVERDRLMSARILYGIDIYGEAIRGAEENIRLAGLGSKTELITKNFFDFHHSHRFDEIITDFPFCTEQRSLHDIELMYRDFFKTIPQLLESENTVVIYSRNRSFLRKYALAYGFTILTEYEISKREMTYLIILTLKKEAV